MRFFQQLFSKQAPNVRIHCYQDYYYAGEILRDKTHKLLTRGIDSIATVDKIAEEELVSQYSFNPSIVGWVAHAEFVNLPVSKLNIQDNPKKILYAVTYVDKHNVEDLANFTLVVNSLIQKTSKNIELVIKPHPRMKTCTLNKYISIIKHKHVKWSLSNEVKLSYAQLLGTVAVVVSSASGLNLDYLAYHSKMFCASNKASIPISIYLNTNSTKKILQSCLKVDSLPTHKHNSGSLIVNDQNSFMDLLQEIIFRNLRYF